MTPPTVDAQLCHCGKEGCIGQPFLREGFVCARTADLQAQVASLEAAQAELRVERDVALRRAAEHQKHYEMALHGWRGCTCTVLTGGTVSVGASCPIHGESQRATKSATPQ